MSQGFGEGVSMLLGIGRCMLLIIKFMSNFRFILSNFLQGEYNDVFLSSLGGVVVLESHG